MLGYNAYFVGCTTTATTCAQPSTHAPSYITKQSELQRVSPAQVVPVLAITQATAELLASMMNKRIYLIFWKHAPGYKKKHT